jgi:hypothetical protein
MSDYFYIIQYILLNSLFFSPKSYPKTTILKEKKVIFAGPYGTTEKTVDVIFM